MTAFQTGKEVNPNQPKKKKKNWEDARDPGQR
jgi:hypothetical protein